MMLQGRVALVTGAAHRIGRTIALALAARKAQVVISYRRSYRDAQHTLKQLAQFPVRAEALYADVTDPASVRRLLAQIERGFGRLDVLVNNAAIFERTPWATLTQRQWHRHLQTNLTGPFLCARAASRLMRKTGAGKIINIVDWAGERPYRDYLPYCVSKAGLSALTKALAKELAPTIHVMAIAPGAVLPPQDMTPAQRQRLATQIPLKRWGLPQDVANAVLFAIEGTDFMTGSVIAVDGGRLIA